MWLLGEKQLQCVDDNFLMMITKASAKLCTQWPNARAELAHVCGRLEWPATSLYYCRSTNQINPLLMSTRFSGEVFITGETLV